MKGAVDEFGRALVRVSIRPPESEDPSEVEVWVDTGFNGDLVLPREVVEKLSLPASGTVKAVLADGSEVALQTFSCAVDWFGSWRDLEVVANDGVYPLLGVGMLLGHDLAISYRSGVLTIE